MLNEEMIRLYMEAADETLEGAQFNLAGGYPGFAVNRAYYAFFYAASALLLTKDISRSKHSGVIAAFREQFVKTGLVEADLSAAYGTAFKARQIADYDMVGATDETQATQVLAQAHRFVGRVRQLLTEAGYP